MNASNANLYLPLVKALAEGKTIQCKTSCKGSGVDKDGWFDMVGDLLFDNPPHFYRIKPEPRRWWIWIDKQTQAAAGASLYPVPSTDKLDCVQVQEVLQ